MPATLSRTRSGWADRSIVPSAPETWWKPVTRFFTSGRGRARQIADSGWTGPPSKSTAGAPASSPPPPTTAEDRPPGARVSPPAGAPPRLVGDEQHDRTVEVRIFEG